MTAKKLETHRQVVSVSAAPHAYAVHHVVHGVNIKYMLCTCSLDELCA